MPIDLEKLTYYEIILDGEDATSTYNNQFTALDYPSFEVAGKIPLSRIAYMKVLEVTIPYTYYVINSVNGSFTLTDTSGSFTVTIAPGTYTPAAIVTELIAKINATPTTFVYGVTFNATNQTLFFVNNAGVSSPFTITFSIGRDTLGRVLGFSAGPQVSQTFLVADGNRLTGSVTQLGGENYLYVNSNAVGGLMDLFLPRGSLRFGNGGPQMAAVPRDTKTFGEPIHWIDPCPQKWFDMAEMTSLSKMDIFITDGPNGDILKFNGKSFMIKVGVLVSDSSTVHGGEITAKKVKITRR